MARQNVTIQRPSVSGGLLVWTNGHVDGHAVPNSGRTLILVSNVGAAASDVTFITPRAAATGAIPDKVTSIVNGTIQPFGRLDKALFNQDDGTLWIDFQAPADIRIAALEY